VLCRVYWSFIVRFFSELEELKIWYISRIMLCGTYKYFVLRFDNNIDMLLSAG